MHGDLSTENEELDDLRVKICNNYYGKLQSINNLLTATELDENKLQILFEEAYSLRKDAMTKADDAYIEYYYAQYLSKTGLENEAGEYYQRALNIWNHPNNPATKKVSRMLD
jgi:hypothetical protein